MVRTNKKSDCETTCRNTQSELDLEDIISKIEENGGPEGVDLSNVNLSGIDLSSKRITEYLEHSNLVGGTKKLPIWATEVIKTSPRGEAFWRIKTKNNIPQTSSPIDISKAYRFSLNLRGAVLRGANFRNAKLERVNLQNANLVEANFENANLWACILDNANLWFANLKNSFIAAASLEYAILTKANMENGNLSYSILRNAVIKNANLKGVTLYGADLTNANLSDTYLGETSLWRANLQGANIPSEIVNSGLLQEKMKTFKSHLDYHLDQDVDQEKSEKIKRKIRAFKRRFCEAKDVYRALRMNFLNEGDYLAASLAYVRMRTMERKTHHPKNSRYCYGWQNLPENPSWYSSALWWFFIRQTVKWILDWVGDLSCGYGEKPFRTLMWAGIILLIFPFLFWYTQGIKSSTGEMNWFDYFNYSVASFSTIGFNHYSTLTPFAQLLTSTESLLGISIVALLMFTLGKRISR